MKKIDAKELLKKYTLGACTDAEKDIVESWYLKSGIDQFEALSEEAIDKSLDRVWSKLSTAPTSGQVTRLWPRIAGQVGILKIAAAVAAITLGVWLYYASDRSGSSSRGIEGSLVYTTDIAPGRNTATLILANGETINLSDAKTGVTIDASTLTYNDGEELSISSESGPRRGGPEVSSETTQFSGSKGAGSRAMSVITPRGGTYHVILPDGTKAWLNAASSVKFPSSFAGEKQRLVEITGEIYFEVAKATRSSLRGKCSGTETSLAQAGAISSGNERIPFIVESRGQRVEVLGTHFNVNAYADEGATKTTLLEGSVKVSSSLSSTSSRKTSKSTILKPGQQSVVSDNHRLKVQQVDPSTVVAWKNGDFIFEQEDFESVLRKVEKWYNVEFVYQKGSFEKLKISGTVSRSKNISSVLEALQLTSKKKFKIEGRRVTIM